MKTYAIWDKQVQKDLPIGFLFCYEKANEYIIELQRDLDEWDAPLLFQKHVREKQFTIPKDVAMLWVRERVIPSGRQNIGSILKRANLTEYNEMALLALFKGKCSQDACFLRETDYNELPEEIKKRSEQNVTECFYTEHQNIICLFRDNLVRKISIEKLAPDFKQLSRILKYEQLLRTVKIGVGGYSISFHESIDIPISALRDKKYEVPITPEDFLSFVKNNLIDTSTACEKMQCTRQNISYLVKKEKLQPVTNNTQENLFTRGDMERLLQN